MRILVHDYSGHPFQVALSRELANRGHDVCHSFSASVETPHGDLARRPTDSPQFSVCPIQLSQSIAKYRFVQRFKLEKEYGGRLKNVCRDFRPDVVLSANTPSLVQHALARWCRSTGVRLGTWVQDLYGIAAYRVLSKKLPGLGHLVGQYFMRLDRAVARLSDAVIVITDDFIPFYQQGGTAANSLHVINNWAPLEELPLTARDNDWSREQNLSPTAVRYIYSGTLSIRHNPELLVRLGQKLDEWGRAELIVISKGDGIEYVKQRVHELQVKSVRCLGFQPFERMHEVFGSADVLVSILEPDAGAFCVPSKVLSYMCAGRSQLVAIPAENLAARLVDQHEMGLICDPADVEAFLSNAKRLFDDPQLRERFGTAARSFAEQHFDLDRIADRFEAILGLRAHRSALTVA